MTKLCFIDTETTSLRHDRRVWEVAVITREPGEPDQEWQAFVSICDLDLGNADLFSLKIGRFHERHPEAGNDPDEARGTIRQQVRQELYREDVVLWQVERLTRGAHLVGAVPNFDAEVLANRMRANDICPSWNYHLVDVEPLAAGWLHRHAAVLENREATVDEAARLRQLATPPWKSDNLTAALGVEVSEEDRHTALGDARWAMRVWDAVVA
jgi:hypothetical protein